MRCCVVRTRTPRNALQGGKIGENGRSGRILTRNALDLTFWVPNYGAKFHQN